MLLSRQRSTRSGKTLRTLNRAARAVAVRICCSSEALERRLLLARMGPEPFYAPAAGAHATEVIHGDEYYLPPARVAPGPNSKFTGQFVVTLADGADSSTKAKKHGGKQAYAFHAPAKTHLWQFEKGSDAKKLSAALKNDKTIVDAYPVYVESPPAAVSDSPRMADLFEAEPNDNAGAANPITIGSTPTLISGAISSASDKDYYSFTLPVRSGVYFDIDAFENGLSATLDSMITVYAANGNTVLGDNDDGRDFDGFVLNDTTATSINVDSAFYMDLAAGTYYVNVSSFGNTTGSYHFSAYSDSTYSSSVPVFESNPGAADTLFLDFNGHSATDTWGTYTVSAFDLSGNAGEWTPGERKAIENMWRIVADAYSPFNINVTTSYAGSYSPDATAFRQVITNDNGSTFGVLGALGVAFLNSYANDGVGRKTAFTFASNFNFAVDPAGPSGDIMGRPIEMGNTSAHEFGHALGLIHYGGTNPQPNAFMHSPDFGLSRERWVSGNSHSNEPPVVFQNDIGIISNLVNTFGLRSDDHGNSRPAASVLTPLGNTYTGSGIITQTSDVDFFRFSGSGITTIALDIPEHLNRLDGEVYLYDAGGALLASGDVADRLSASLNFPLPSAGDYYVEVRSDGAPGEIGQYSLRINTTVSGGGEGSIAGKVFRDVTLNNVFDAGDTALSNVTVFLDADNDGSLDAGEINTLSNGSGDYLFPGLVDGTYHVRETVPSGYVSNVTQTIVVSGGAAMTGVQFGNWPTMYQGLSSGDSWTVRLKAGDATRIQVLEMLGAAPTVTYEAPHAVVMSLGFHGSGGSDLLSVQSAPAFLPIDFSGEDGADQAVLGASAGATVVFNGGADASIDSAVYNASTGSNSIAITDAQVTGGAGNILTYAQLESLTIEALGGSDTITLSSGAVGAGVVINAGDGNDTVNVGAGDLDELPAGITVNGGTGTDQLVIDDQLNAFDDQYDVTASSVTRDFFGGATYSSFDGLTLHGQSGPNLIIVSSTDAATPVTVNGGDGSDTLEHFGSSSPILFNGGLDPADEDYVRVRAGTYTFNANANLGSANLWVRSENGANAIFNSSQTLRGLIISSGGNVTLTANGSRLIDTRELFLTSGKLDLADNDMIVRTGALGTWNGTAYTDLRGLVDSGRGNSAPLWNGSGIVTSMASANDLKTIGVASAAELFNLAPTATTIWNGQTVNGSAILFKFTWGGDANLDGKINIDDYGRIDGNVSQSGSVFGFFRGDFNYDGKINIDDYGIIDGNINQQIGTL